MDPVEYFKAAFSDLPSLLLLSSPNAAGTATTTAGATSADTIASTTTTHHANSVAEMLSPLPLGPSSAPLYGGSYFESSPVNNNNNHGAHVSAASDQGYSGPVPLPVTATIGEGPDHSSGNAAAMAAFMYPWSAMAPSGPNGGNNGGIAPPPPPPPSGMSAPGPPTVALLPPWADQYHVLHTMPSALGQSMMVPSGSNNGYHRSSSHRVMGGGVETSSDRRHRRHHRRHRQHSDLPSQPHQQQSRKYRSRNRSRDGGSGYRGSQSRTGTAAGAAASSSAARSRSRLRSRSPSRHHRSHRRSSARRGPPEGSRREDPTDPRRPPPPLPSLPRNVASVGAPDWGIGIQLAPTPAGAAAAAAAARLHRGGCGDSAVLLMQSSSNGNNSNSIATPITGPSGTALMATAGGGVLTVPIVQGPRMASTKHLQQTTSTSSVSDVLHQLVVEFGLGGSGDGGGSDWVGLGAFSFLHLVFSFVFP
ncbi:hypothetical protein BC828DRAFT_215994 [Blastocladiella britannica]|nr:hypothetical protein BC828DRAFT_215994 [Blastocladiella britannica]